MPNTSARTAFGRAFLDYLRNLPAQLVLFVTSVLATVQASTTISDQWMWNGIAVTCLGTAGLAALFNMVFFMRQAAVTSPWSPSWLVAKIAAGLLATVVPLAFIASAIFNSRSLLRALFPHAAG